VADGHRRVPGSQGDPGAPVLVTGRVLDANGQPAAGAQMLLTVFDPSNIVVGPRIGTAYSGSFTANGDGSFVLHLAPTAELLAVGAQNGGFVNFQLTGNLGSPQISLWGFSRELKSEGWADDPPTVVLRPAGGGPNDPHPVSTMQPGE
jgi:hypothetical protein